MSIARGENTEAQVELGGAEQRQDELSEDADTKWTEDGTREPSPQSTDGDVIRGDEMMGDDGVNDELNEDEKPEAMGDIVAENPTSEQKESETKASPPRTKKTWRELKAENPEHPFPQDFNF